MTQEEIKRELDFQLHNSILKRDVGLFKLLIELGADINGTLWGRPLTIAAGFYNDEGWEMVDYLLSKGVDINAKNKLGKTALYEMYEMENWGSGWGLIKRGADVNVKCRGGKTLLHLMVEECKPDRVRVLLKAGADPNIKNNKGLTPRELACKMLDDMTDDSDFRKKFALEDILKIIAFRGVF